MFEDVIKHYPDFPKAGIDFIDVLPFLQNKEAFKEAIAEIDRLLAEKEADILKV